MVMQYPCTCSSALIAVPKDTSGVAMAATRELIRRGVSRLHLVCVPTSGLQADMLIGAGAVQTVETSAITMGEFGAAPRFVEAIRNASIKVMDATCPAIYAALQAGEKGLPFIPLRGLLGTDVLRHRADWRVIDNPFADERSDRRAAGDPAGRVRSSMRAWPTASATCSSAASAK